MKLAFVPLSVITSVLLSSWPGWAATGDFPSTILSSGPVGYWRLNETTPPPAPRPAANLGSLGRVVDGQYQVGPRLGEPGALTGSSATSVRFFNPRMDVSYGGSRVEAPYDDRLNPAGPF